MPASRITSVTPWPKTEVRPAAVPSGSRFVCLFENDLGIDDVEEAVYLKQGVEQDELWIVSGYGLEACEDPERLADLHDSEVLIWGLAVTRSAGGKDANVAREMLEALIRSRVGHGWPTRILRGGIVTQRAFDRLLARLEAELSANAEAAKAQPSEIVEKARSLGLNPTPTGTHPTLWHANCPGTSHFIYLNARLDEFFCGYCKRQGGPDALSVFATSRRTKAASG